MCSTEDDEQLKNVPTNDNQIVASKTDDKKTNEQGFKELIMMKTYYDFSRMSFPGKRIYIFPNRVNLRIIWCEFLEDVQFVFVNGAEIYFYGNVFRGSALFECFESAKSTFMCCHFYKSVYNISHEKADLIFQQNNCYGDTLLSDKNNAEGCLSVLECKFYKNGQFRSFDDSIFERSQNEQDSFFAGIKSYTPKNRSLIPKDNKMGNRSLAQIKEKIASYEQDITDDDNGKLYLYGSHNTPQWELYLKGEPGLFFYALFWSIITIIYIGKMVIFPLVNLIFP